MSPTDEFKLFVTKTMKTKRIEKTDSSCIVQCMVLLFLIAHSYKFPVGDWK